MSAGWWELRLSVPGSIADDAAAALFETGASGVQLVGAETLPPPDENLTAVADEIELVFEDDGSAAELIVSFEGIDSAQDATQEILQVLTDIGIHLESSDLHWQRREDTDWSERWKEFFDPLQLSPRLWVVPSWREDFEPPPGSLSLQIDPGMAFGTGQHATTALCAELIDRRVRMSEPQSLLDVGTGSGILAVAAAMLGIEQIVAIDIDPEAIEATRTNAERNGVSSRIDVSETPIVQVTGTFHWVVANILAKPLIQMARPLLERTAPAGHLVVSGILSGLQANEVAHALIGAAPDAGHEGFELIETVERGEWCALRFGSRPASV